MKKFKIQIIFFLLPIILFSYYADLLISVNLKKSNSFAVGEFSTWNAIIDGKINSSIIIYGSSRAWVHFNPTIISNKLNVKCYNLGIDGHNFWLQYLRHTLLLENNTKPKLIIHSLDIFTLSKVSDLYNSNQFLPYMLFNNEIRNATVSYNGFESTDFFIPIIRYYGNKMAIKNAISMYNNESNIIKRIKGYEGQTRIWNKDFENAKKKLNTFKIELDSKSIILFEKYLNECKSKKIKLIFVYSPEYIEGQKIVINRNEIFDIYKKYSKKYNIPFYDYSYHSISYNKKYFYNSLHLNKIGSELFTNKLIDTLRSNNFKLQNLN